jgi:FkbM family methyltransferase
VATPTETPALSARAKLFARRALYTVLGDWGLERVQARYWAGKLANGRGYEHETSLLPRLVEPGDVCIDVGANFGQYTVPLSRIVGPSGRVLSFEPVPYSGRVLRRVVARTGLSNVTIHDVAASDHEGSVRMSVPSAGARVFQFGLAHVSPDADGGDDGESRTSDARCVTLDDYLADEDLARLSFLKIDVEGAELMVLRGARRLLDTARPIVLCEVEERHTARYQHRPADVLELLVNHGYEAYVARGEQLSRVDELDDSNNNYFFVPPERAGVLDGLVAP